MAGRRGVNAGRPFAGKNHALARFSLCNARFSAFLNAQLTANATFPIFRAGFLLWLALLGIGPAIYAGPIPGAGNGVTNSPIVRSGMAEFATVAQRPEPSNTREDSDRLVLYLSGAFAAFGFLTIVFAAILHWTVVNRLATAVDHFRAAYVPRAVESSAIPSLEPTLARLERVIARLEHVTEMPKPASVTTPSTVPDIVANGTPANRPEVSAAVIAPPAPAVRDESENIAVFIGKGQSLLALEKPDEALMCFEKALAVDSKNADVWVRKGSALEQMQKWNDALEAYDRAIALDGGMTIAYLRKGAVFNRLQHHEAALECYERALATQEKSAPPR